MHDGPFTFGAIDAWRIRIPMREPFRISSGEVTEKDAIVIRVWDGDAFGWGESSAMPGAFYSADTPDSCEAALTGSLLPSLTGRSFASVELLETYLAANVPSGFVRVAVETAAWELLARSRGVSVRSLLGLPDARIPSGLAIGLYDSLSELRAALERYDPRQYKRLKIKIKRGYDVELVRAVRQWYGDIPLFVDANADYTAADFAVFEQLDAFHLMMYEQPLGRDALDDSAGLQRRVSTPICHDESAESLAMVERAIAIGACRIVNIKLQRVGGYLPALRIIGACEKAGIPVWMGTMPELGIGSAQALALASHAAFQFPTDVEPSDRWYMDDILRPILTLRDGHLELPAGPGIGFAVDEAKLERYAIRQWRWE